MSEQRAIGVLVVDDSAVVRRLISQGLGDDAGIRVVGAAADGRAAIDMVRAVSPDVVLLDVEMPTMSGLEALPKILEARRETVVIMASALTRRHAGMSLRALQLGAADYVPKPEAGSALQLFLDELKAKIKAHARNRAAHAAAAAAPTLRPVRAAAVAIGSSTGGPPALLKVMGRAQGRVRTPVFITQHMPATFTAMLAEQLGQVSGARACEGADGMLIERGCIYVAPGGRHMTVERNGDVLFIKLLDTEPENFCKPAVDPMFRSLAKAYGAGVLGAVLTGMGRDGADGCTAIAEAGGRFIVQDEATSVVWGMPGAAFRTGRALAQLPLEAAADFLAGAMSSSQ